MKQTNISVFIPHYGCTHICSFCNQKTISGHSEPVTEKELESILEGQLENLKDSGTKAQIAFFGGQLYRNRQGLYDKTADGSQALYRRIS